MRFALALLSTALVCGGPALADVIRYTTNPSAYPDVTGVLTAEYGTAAFPPLAETTQSYYVTPTGLPSTLTFRFTADTGSFSFSFGYYFDSPAMRAIDTSTNVGRRAYAAAALAVGNAFQVFDDRLVNPGATATATIPGGTTLGFFLIPDDTLASYRANPARFTPSTLNPTANRFPLFSVADADPGGFDQLMSFFGTSAVTGAPTNLFAFEDLTRFGLSDDDFSDLVFTVEGVQPVDIAQATPEPLSVVVFGGLAAVGGLAARRRRKATA